MMFELLGLMEYYHPRMQLRLQLARIMILNLLNLYSLIWALFGKINGMTERFGHMRSSQQKKSTTTASPLSTSESTSTSTIPTPTVKSIADTVISRITDVLYQSSTDYPTETTENYDYSNTNYFEYEEPDTKLSTVETSSAEPFINFTESFTEFTDTFYMDNDFGNLTDFYSNSSGDLFENSNFNMSNLINSSGFEASNFNNSVFNFTNVEPISSAFQSLQYSLLQHEPSPFMDMESLNSTAKLELRKLCWETMFGQELVKLTVMDLVRK